MRGEFSQEFGQELLLQNKNYDIHNILEDIKKNSEEEKDEIHTDSSGFFSGMLTAISENIRLKFTGIHLRIEDINCSIKDQAFSFGLICDSIQYNITNRHYETNKFVSREEKLKENKTFSQLSFSGVALYWISGGSEYW